MTAFLDKARQARDATKRLVEQFLLEDPTCRDARIVLVIACMFFATSLLPILAGVLEGDGGPTWRRGATPAGFGTLFLLWWLGLIIRGRFSILLRLTAFLLVLLFAVFVIPGATGTL